MTDETRTEPEQDAEPRTIHASLVVNDFIVSADHIFKPNEMKARAEWE